MIHYNSDLVQLAGLRELEAVQGSLRIKYNDALPSLHGLNSLRAVGEYISVLYNDSLESLRGFSGLASVGNACTDDMVYCGQLLISSNASLPPCEGEWLVENFLSVNDGFHYGSIVITNNTGTGSCD